MVVFNRVPPREADLLLPLVDASGNDIKTVLELGNKKSSGRAYKKDFENMNISHTSVDLNGKDGSLKLDLQEPLNLGQFDMVTNFGTTEHVDIQYPVWKNIHDSLKVGGIFVGETPHPGSLPGHGMWYPTMEFYKEFALLNNYAIEKLFEAGEEDSRLIFWRMNKKCEGEFVMPRKDLIVSQSEGYKPTELCELAFKYGADKCPQIVHWYTPYYYEYLKDKRQAIKKVFEMGIGGGGMKRMVRRICAEMPSFTGYKIGASLRMWRDFFPNAMIYGADNNAGIIFEDDRIKTYHCDENNDEDVKKLVEEMGTDIDLVIDDGSHRTSDQIHLCQTLLPLLNENVIYFIEDCRRPEQVRDSLSQYGSSIIELQGKGENPRQDRLILIRRANV